MSAWRGSTRSSRLPADWKQRRLLVKARAGGRCQAVDDGTRCPLPGSECDHVVPGDDHSEGNLEWLCSPHHRDKALAEAAAARQLAPRRRPPEPHPGALH